MGAGQDFKEAMIEMDLLIKARSALDNFNESVENAPGFTDDIQKILNIIDDIVLGKEKEQFELLIQKTMEIQKRGWEKLLMVSLKDIMI